MLDSLSQDFSDQMAGWPWVFIHPQNSTFFVDDCTRAKAIKHIHFDLLRGPKQIKHIPSRFPKINKAMAMLPICYPGIIAVFIHWHALLSLQGIEVPLPSLFQQLPLTVFGKQESVSCSRLLHSCYWILAQAKTLGVLMRLPATLAAQTVMFPEHCNVHSRPHLGILLLRWH